MISVAKPQHNDHWVESGQELLRTNTLEILTNPKMEEVCLENEDTGSSEIREIMKF